MVHTEVYTQGKVKGNFELVTPTNLDDFISTFEGPNEELITRMVAAKNFVVFHSDHDLWITDKATALEQVEMAKKDGQNMDLDGLIRGMEIRAVMIED